VIRSHEAIANRLPTKWQIGNGAANAPTLKIRTLSPDAVQETRSVHHNGARLPQRKLGWYPINYVKTALTTINFSVYCSTRLIFRDAHIGRHMIFVDT
jgi:hypothetical protein